MNLEKHDSHFYQCVVTVKEGAASTLATLYSNVLSVDVQSKLCLFPGSLNFLSLEHLATPLV